MNPVRCVGNEQASRIAGAVGDKGFKVGLSWTPRNHKSVKVLENVPLDILQFHGEESQDYCAGYGRPYWKTIRVREPGQLDAQIAQYEGASGILLDTWHPTQAGGTGKAFDWSLAEGLTLSSR